MLDNDGEFDLFSEVRATLRFLQSNYELISPYLPRGLNGSLKLEFCHFGVHFFNCQGWVVHYQLVICEVSLLEHHSFRPGSVLIRVVQAFSEILQLVRVQLKGVSQAIELVLKGTLLDDCLLTDGRY